MIKNIYRRGFTFVELLVTIVLLGVVGGIVIYNMTGISTSSKDTEYERFVASVKSAAATYAEANSELTESLYVDKAFVYVTVGDLIEGGYLDEKSTNPYTGEYINPDEKVKASLDSTTGAVIYEYPVEDTAHKESYLVAMDDYMVFGEPYDCYSGFGSYEFSVASEDGTLVIPDPSSDTEWKRTKAGIIKHYGVTCEMPENFYYYDGSYNGPWGAQAIADMKDNIRDNHAEYYFLNSTPKEGERYESGTYDIKYTWVSDTGTKKQFKRKLRAMDKAKAVLSFNKQYYNSKYEGNDVDQNGNIKATFDKPEYDASTGKWYPLAFNVTLEGADNAKALVDLRVVDTHGKQKNNYVSTNTSGIDVKNGTYYIVNDGANWYKFSYTVYGHHLTSYKYPAENEYLLASDLVVPTAFISRVDSDSEGKAIKNGQGLWVTARDVNVTGGVLNSLDDASYNVNIHKGDTHISIPAFDNKIYSPSGIAFLEYIGVEDPNSKTEDTGRFNTLKSIPGLDKTYDVTQFAFNNAGSVDVKVDALKTPNSLSNWRYVRIRAVNKDGFVGSWSDPVQVFVSDKIDNVASSMCTPGSTGCKSSEVTDVKNNCNKESATVEKGLLTKFTDSSLAPRVKMNGLKLVVANATSENGYTTGIADYATGTFSVNVIRYGTWGVQTCDGYYSTSYSYTTTVTTNISANVSDQCRRAVQDNYKELNLCSISGDSFSGKYAISYNPYYGWVDRRTAEQFGGNIAVTGVSTCLWDSTARSESFTVSVSHGESTTRSSTFQNAFNTSLKVVSVGTNGKCATKCYVRFRPRIYIVSGKGTSAEPYELSLYV